MNDQNQTKPSADKAARDFEDLVDLQFIELRNLISRSKEYAKQLTDRTFLESLKNMDQEMWKKRDKIIKAFRELDEKR